MDVAAWLRGLGLDEYEPAFRDNRIDMRVLPKLTADDLKDLGVTTIGDRRILLDALAMLREPTSATGSAEPAPATPMPEGRDATASAEAERRQITVMFCDLVGSTALSARLDPEDLSAVIGAYHRCAAAVIERAGGFVAKYMGDGVLAYFGYPRADEHDVERAVRAGLALVAGVPRLDTAAETRLQVRIGIATGIVVVGDLIGAGAAQELTVVGETPNLAARLQVLAEPGTVVIAASTWRLTAGLFDYEDLGAVEIKGLAAPVAAARVLRESGAESRFEALRASATPLVGRDEELDLLRRRWQQAKAGEGSVVLVSGESGIGKSRLAQTLLERPSGEPHTRLRSFCSPHHQDDALYPTITQLERTAGFRREDTVEQRLNKLEAALALATNDLGEAVPLLAALLSIPSSERYPPLDLAPQKRRERTLQALAAQVAGLAARRPVLMVFEDAHWSDPTSLDLLDLIIDRVPITRVLLIITFRPEFTPPWTGHPHVSLLTLNRLSPQQRAEMITGITRGKALPQEIGDQIVDRTDGVPLFVEELTKPVVESGMLTDVGDHYTAAGPLTPMAIPATLQASLLARLDRLAPVREVAQIGAALGRQFSHELIAAVASKPQPELDKALAQLVEAELIYRRGTPPDAEYTFKHALVQDAAYGTLLRSRREQLHARIATALEDRFPEIVAAQPALLAHHCSEAGLTEKAVDYWLAAGRQAWGRSAPAEAVARLRRGLALIPSLTDTEWRGAHEFDLQIALGQVLNASGGWGVPEVGEAYARARQLAVTLSRPRALLFALYGQWAFHALGADLERAGQLAEEMRHLGETSDDVPTQVLGYCSSAYTCMHAGELIGARTYVENGLALYDPAHRPAYVGISTNDLLVLLRDQSSLTLACLGYLDRAWSRADAAVAEARRLGHPFTLSDTLSWACIRGWCVGLEPQSLLRCADDL
jgi:class 3 adenylate cyclase